MSGHAIWVVLALTAAAGAMIPLGSGLAWIERIRPGHLRQDALHAIVAFGGGALLSAVALVLVPQGSLRLGTASMSLAFASGAATFLLVDRAIQRRGGRASQLLAMVMDFVPESLALGAAFATGGGSGPLLAFLIGLQNLPEGLNAHRELVDTGTPNAHAFAFLAPLALLGPLAGGLGFLLLADQPVINGFVFLFAAGGILYLVFQDIAPLAHRRGHWAPALGAVAGFLMGMVAHQLIGSA